MHACILKSPWETETTRLWRSSSLAGRMWNRTEKLSSHSELGPQTEGPSQTIPPIFQSLDPPSWGPTYHGADIFALPNCWRTKSVAKKKKKKNYFNLLNFEMVCYISVDKKNRSWYWNWDATIRKDIKHVTLSWWLGIGVMFCSIVLQRKRANRFFCKNICIYIYIYIYISFVYVHTHTIHIIC